MLNGSLVINPIVYLGSPYFILWPFWWVSSRLEFAFYCVLMAVVLLVSWLFLLLYGCETFSFLVHCFVSLFMWMYLCLHGYEAFSCYASADVEFQSLYYLVLTLSLLFVALGLLTASFRIGGTLLLVVLHVCKVFFLSFVLHCSLVLLLLQVINFHIHWILQFSLLLELCIGFICLSILSLLGVLLVCLAFLHSCCIVL